MTHHGPTPEPPATSQQAPAEVPIEIELQARLAEANGLLTAARERAVHDLISQHRLIEENKALTAQLTEAQDAYEQLARLVEQPDQNTTAPAPAPSEN